MSVRQPQISTTVSVHTREVYNKLVAKYGSGTTVLSIALRNLYKQDLELEEIEKQLKQEMAHV